MTLSMFALFFWIHARPRHWNVQTVLIYNEMNNIHCIQFAYKFKGLSEVGRKVDWGSFFHTVLHRELK